MSAERTRAVVLVSLAGALAACQKGPRLDPGPAPSPPAVAFASSGAPKASPSRPVPSRPLDTGDHRDSSAVLGVVRAWNDATNAHDLVKLAELYDDQLELYGTSVTRARALTLKRAAFSQHLRDELDGIVVSAEGHASFQKRTTQKVGAPREVTGYLDVGRGDGGAWRIQSEGDITTDRNLERRRATRCSSAVDALVWATPEAKHAIEAIGQAAAEMDAADSVHAGGLLSEPTPEDPLYTVSICEVYADRMPCFVRFEVDAKLGRVTLSEMGSEARAVATDPALVSAVQAACR